MRTPDSDRVTASAVDAPTTPLLVAESLSVVYRVYEESRPRLRDVFAKGMKSRAFREIHAVRGVSLKLDPGDNLGVIGRNGSGKSTLLRALSGGLPVQSGAVHARSRPMLLGVGAVLNPNLSGRRNVLLGGLALGLSRRDVDERFDEIVAFSGLEEFIDLPMRAYSSGMKARLHFAISTAVTPEMLFIDEALAVGDQEFKEKSWERIRELRHGAGAIILVSHNLSEIEETCTRAMWMDRGSVLASGDPTEVVTRYKESAT